MIACKTLFSWIFSLLTFQSLHAIPLAEEFRQFGYLKISDKKHARSTFDSLYAYFDELIAFLQTHPDWAQKLYGAKERFIRSKDRNRYSTDFFGFYDGRSQISFYYSAHFHEFICSRYPGFNQVPEIARFLESCFEIQKPCGHVFDEAASELGVETIFSEGSPVLLKVIKYLPSYIATTPHYDGTAFSLFLDSTDNQSLLLSAYKSSFVAEDFSSLLGHDQNSILLIPGAHLTEFSIYPTPHVVAESGKSRYATIAFAMRPNYTPQKIELSPLPKTRNK